MDISDFALKYAVKNAFEHSGTPEMGAVVGKLKALFPDTPVPECVQAAKDAVQHVSSLSIQELEAEYKKYKEEGFELQPQEQREGLPSLDWAEDGKEPVVTRFAPNPNGPFHLGSARAAVLSHAYAREYNGKFILRFDDTDPKIKKPIENAEELFHQDLAFLGCSVDEQVFASDRLDLYLKYVFKLAKQGFAYVCRCDPEKWREGISNKQRCGCGDHSPGENYALLEKMQSHELKEGSAVVRLKTDPSHPDPSVRDWWLARVVDAPVHPRVRGHYLWPSYNLASALDDHLLGVTLIIRGQEHQQNETKQRFLYNYFGWTYPHSMYTGRLSLEGTVLSTSKIAAGIASGEYTGWDDPKLGTIQAFRRRGFQGKALVQTLLALGTRGSDATIEWKSLAAKNTAIIEPGSTRAVFFAHPVRLTAQGVPAKEVACEGMPVSLLGGVQTFTTDRALIEDRVGKVVRLREAYNLQILRVSELDAEGSFAGDTKISETVPWLPDGQGTPATLRTPQKTHEGLASPSLAQAKPGDIAQLETIGFARVDAVKDGTVELWFTHA